uniref:Intraflagellar transport 25 n=1 Tax=Bos taurus TaxID=9913 RepID=A0ABI0NQ29_BOVIN
MRKVDLCLSSEGTEVIFATSSDEKHPPENMIDGNPETFWTTTGMFPQEFIICFHKHVRIEKLVIQSYFVRTLRIEKSTSKEPVDFEQWIERDLVHTEGQLQNEEILVRNKIGHCVEIQDISESPVSASIIICHSFCVSLYHLPSMHIFFCVFSSYKDNIMLN